MRLKPKHISLLVLFFLIMVAPLFFPSGFYFRVGALIFINAIAVTGLVILIGYAGQISLGHAGFVGIGAYSCALAPVHLGIPPVFAIVLGAGLSAGLAWIVGRPILKLHGYYLGVATLGLGILISMVLANEAQWTGGPDGIAVPDLGLRGILRDWGFRSVRASYGIGWPVP
jgi:branched-chain amino acid transport system permease protein